MLRQPDLRWYCIRWKIQIIVEWYIYSKPRRIWFGALVERMVWRKLERKLLPHVALLIALRQDFGPVSEAKAFQR